MTEENLNNLISTKSDNFFPNDPEERKALKNIFTILLKSSRVDFFHYRHATILRRLSRRMTLCKQACYVDYFAYLQSNYDEVEQLYDDLLLSYTHFFRDPHVFDILKQKICPQMIEDRSAKVPIRIWVPGCSTGEEVYSLAICFYEFFEQSKTKAAVQFFGTDLVERHIKKARQGLYSDSIAKEVSKERLDKFFDKTSDGWKVTKHIREMCVFAIQNITQDPPLSNIDLVSCRNVLIYFDAVFQETAIPLFHFALKPSGFLLLGTSETMGRFPHFFNVTDKKINLYAKRTLSVKPNYKFPVYSNLPKLKKMVKVRNTTERFSVTPNGIINFSGLRQKIDTILLDNYSPPGVLIDNNMQISQFIGNVFPYLGPSNGEASLKLSRMVGEGLMPDLYVAIEEVKKKKGKVRKRNINFQQNGNIITTDISVIPVTMDSEAYGMNFLILFEKPESPVLKPGSTLLKNTINDELLYLKNELQLAKEHLQSIIEEKDEVNQELWAANEEVQSTNEELQSVNEEMEAAKEELESSNEELLSLNEELQSKNRELTVSKDFAENLLETANIIVLTLDLSANIITFNKYAEELTGYKKEEVIGKNWLELFIAPKNIDEVSKVVADAFKSVPEASHNENHIVLKSGLERLISWRNNILRNASGKVNGILSIGIDITEHKLAEKALQESQSKLLMSQYIAQMGDFEWNILTGETSWSSGMYHLLKFNIDDEIDINKVNKEIHHPEDVERVNTWLMDSIASGKKELIPNEYRLICKDGEVIYVQTNGRIQYKDGKAVKLFGTCLNISAHKKAEVEKEIAQQYAAAQEKQALVGQIAGKIAHDFNNILGVIMGNAELSIMDCDNPDTKKIFELIFDQTVQGKNLTRNLVAFAKDQELKQEFFGINNKINLVLDLLKKDLKNIKVIKEFETNLPSLLADSGMIEHAIVNLFQNAIHALGKVENPKILIKTYCIDNSWVKENYFNESICIEVKDNGCGIPKEHLDNIYLPSFTLKGSKDILGCYDKDVKGTGYGMSNIKKYVEQHKGTIMVESELGKGTVFSIYLPVTKKELTNKEKAEITKTKTHYGKKILLVEDEPAIADIQSRILTHKPCNHHVDIAADGDKAIELLNKNTYDFISLDYVLPGTTTGMDVYNHFRKINKTTPILFISGNIEFLESIKALKQKDINIDHLSKPCQNKEYLKSINDLLERTIGLKSFKKD
jgi:PAS domain S-box-containing protein